MSSFLYNLIVLPLYTVIAFLFNYLWQNTQNICLIIFIISAVLFVVCLPLYLKADLLQSEEQKMQEKLKDKVALIKRNYRGDERHMLLVTYYRQMHYHPIMRLRSSLGLLLQIPFFMAAYFFFTELNLLNKTHVWKITNLSQPDQLAVIAGYHVNVLPVIMTLINILAIYAYTKKKSLKENLALILVSLIFLVLLYEAPSGLVLFWIFNNLFSLIKNICLNFVSRERLIKITWLAAFVGICFLQAYLKKEINMVTFMILGLLVIFGNAITKAYSHFLNYRMTFVLSVSVLFLLIGIYVPLNSISTSPTEFIYADSSPLGIVFFNATVWAGLLLFWGGLFYYLVNEKIRKVLSIMALFGVTYALCNLFLVKMPGWSLSDRLVFETDKVNFYNVLFSPYIHLISVITIPIILFFLLFWKKEGAIRKVIFCVLLTTLILCIPKFYRTVTIMNKYEKEANDTSDPNQKLIHLSKDGKNVIVFFLDGFVNTYAAVAFEEDPNLKKQFSGFTYYPNTLSHALYTSLGYLPILGGYEYTPLQMDERDGPFEEKLKQAVTVLPAIFSNNDWNAKVLNPIDIGWTKYVKWGNVSIKEGEKLSTPILYHEHNIEYQQIPDSIILKSSAENNTLQISETVKDNVLFYSLLPFLSPKKREYVYDEGYYHHEYKKYKRRYRKEFVRCYSQLAELGTLTDFESNKNSFIVVNNNMPHTPDWVSYPNYDLNPVNDSSYKPKLRSDANYKSLIEYHVNMVSLKLIGKYMDFLKEKGIYDNTRIIIVSDHGYNVDLNGYSKEQSKFFGHFNPILMFKDFNQKGDLKTNNDFMTNADVPTLTVKNLIKKPINPYTGVILSDALKKDMKKNGMILKHDSKWSPSYYMRQSKVFLQDDVYYVVKGDFHDLKNWKGDFKLKDAMKLLKGK